MHVPYPGLPQPNRPNQPGQPAQPAQPPQRMLPGFIEHTMPQPLDPYQRLYQDRIIFLGARLTDESANDVVARLLDLDSDGSDMEITLQINSAGGSWQAMLAVYDAMAFIGKSVRTICIGQADGPAAVLLASGAPGRRFVLPLAQIVLRQPETDAVPSADVRTELDKVTWQRDQVERILADATGRSRDQVHADIDRPKLLTAQDAVDYGVVDGILPSRR